MGANLIQRPIKKILFFVFFEPFRPRSTSKLAKNLHWYHTQNLMLISDFFNLEFYEKVNNFQAKKLLTKEVTEQWSFWLLLLSVYNFLG